MSDNRASKKKIFIVDDADFIIDMLRMLLQGDGHTVVGSAVNGPDAIEQLRSLSGDSVPDLVLIDFQMPKMNGMATIAKIREILPQVKFLLVSANATLPIVTQAKELGVSGFIAKPFEPADVLKAVANIA